MTEPGETITMTVAEAKAAKALRQGRAISKCVELLVGLDDFDSAHDAARYIWRLFEEQASKAKDGPLVEDDLVHRVCDRCGAVQHVRMSRAPEPIHTVCGGMWRQEPAYGEDSA